MREISLQAYQTAVLNAIVDEEIARNTVKQIIGTGLPQVSTSYSFQDFLKLPTTLLPGEFSNPPSSTPIPVKFGTKYNSTAGIDCSAFVQQTLNTHFNITAPRSTTQQVNMGVDVGRDAMQVGDLVFFRTGYATKHVGFYLGDGKFLHASTKVGVTISRLDDLYWRKTFWKVRRVM